MPCIALAMSVVPCAAAAVPACRGCLAHGFGGLLQILGRLLGLLLLLGFSARRREQRGNHHQPLNRSVA